MCLATHKRSGLNEWGEDGYIGQPLSRAKKGGGGGNEWSERGGLSGDRETCEKQEQRLDKKNVTLKREREGAPSSVSTAIREHFRSIPIIHWPEEDPPVHPTPRRKEWLHLREHGDMPALSSCPGFIGLEQSLPNYSAVPLPLLT